MAIRFIYPSESPFLVWPLRSLLSNLWSFCSQVIDPAVTTSLDVIVHSSAARSSLLKHNSWYRRLCVKKAQYTHLQKDYLNIHQQHTQLSRPWAMLSSIPRYHWSTTTWQPILKAKSHFNMSDSEDKQRQKVIQLKGANNNAAWLIDVENVLEPSQHHQPAMGTLYWRPKQNQSETILRCRSCCACCLQAIYNQVYQSRFETHKKVDPHALCAKLWLTYLSE